MDLLCGNCRDSVPHPDLLYSVDWTENSVCGACKHEKVVEAMRASREALDQSMAVVLAGTWESEDGKYLKAMRNMKLEACRWTIDIDSPLTPDCQLEWLAYRRLLNRMTVDQSVDSWEWPEEPERRMP